MNLSSLLTQLVIPINLGVVLLLIATVLLISKRRKRAFSVGFIAIAWVLFWSLPAASIWLGGHLENRYFYEQAADAPTADAIVVLGGQTASGRHNWFAPYDPDKATTRIQRGADLYAAKRAPLIMVSGAALDGGTSEAQGMARYLQQQGIPPEDIIIEESSFTTRENATYSAEKLKKHNIKRILLVTSALHMPRSVASFSKEDDLVIIPAPVAPQITRPDDSWLAIWKPSYRTLNASRSIIKEYVGLLVYWVRGWV